MDDRLTVCLATNVVGVKREPIQPWADQAPSSMGLVDRDTGRYPRSQQTREREIDLARFQQGARFALVPSDPERGTNGT